MDFLLSWEFLLLIITVLFLFPYLGGPLMILTTMRIQAEPELVPFDSEDELLPREVTNFFHRTVAALQPTGFEVVTGLALPSPVTNVKTLLLLLANRLTGDSAMVAVIHGQTIGPIQLKNPYVEIVSRFRDGTVLQTNNSQDFGAFPPRPGFQTFRFPMVADADRLFRLHQGLVRRHEGNTSGKILRLDEEFHGDAATYLTFAMAEEMTAARKAGYIYLGQDEINYRPTLKGAFLMTWQELWPFKAIRKLRRKQKALNLLSELE